MRDSLGSRHLRRQLPALALAACALACGTEAPAFAAPPAHSAAAKLLRVELRRQFTRKPRLALNQAFLRRAQAAGAILPFTIRLRRPYEGGPGDDVIGLTWDTAATAWPLAGTMPAAATSSTVDGALTYEWDYSADTSGYATLGTTETVIGGGISLTGTGFPIAVPDPGSACDKVSTLDATGVSFTSAGVRFGTVNPFSGQVNGTINLRSSVRTAFRPCGADPATTPATALPVATSTAADPPLPIAFQGQFSVSPSVSSDGAIRLGVLRITPSIPQRTTFGLVNACTDATAADGCGRQAFPVRTKIISLNAEVLAGDRMPGPPPPPS
jgi:hypothetical protein